jgi:hypothetical protein
MHRKEPRCEGFVVLGFDLAPFLKNEPVDQVDMLEPKGCNSPRTRARDHHKGKHSLIASLNFGAL